MFLNYEKLLPIHFRERSLKKKEKVKVDGEYRLKVTRQEEVKKDQIALIRGSIRKRCRIEVGNVILVSLREFEERKVDIIHAYKHDDVNTLRRQNKLPQSKIFENEIHVIVEFFIFFLAFRKLM